MESGSISHMLYERVEDEDPISLSVRGPLCACRLQRREVNLHLYSIACSIARVSTLCREEALGASEGSPVLTGINQPHDVSEQRTDFGMWSVHRKGLRLTHTMV